MPGTARVPDLPCVWRLDRFWTSGFTSLLMETLSAEYFKKLPPRFHYILSDRNVDVSQSMGCMWFETVRQRTSASTWTQNWSFISQQEEQWGSNGNDKSDEGMKCILHIKTYMHMRVWGQWCMRIVCILMHIDIPKSITAGLSQWPRAAYRPRPAIGARRPARPAAPSLTYIDIMQHFIYILYVLYTEYDGLHKKYSGLTGPYVNNQEILRPFPLSLVTLLSRLVYAVGVYLMPM